MKKIIAFALSAVLALGLLAACGGNNGEPGTGGEGTAGAETGTGGGGAVSLQLALWDTNQLAAAEAMIELYTSENPHVTIETQITPYKGGEYWTKLETSMAGGTAPDVFWVNALHVEDYVDGGMMLPLDEALAASDLDLAANFPAALIELYNVGGVQYAVPKDYDTNGVFYNKQMFDDAGVAYPSDDWSWEDMVETARKLTDADKGVYGIAAPLAFQECYYNTIFAAGGWVLNDGATESGFADAATQKGIQCWIDLIDEGVAPSLADVTESGQSAMFQSGTVAMIWAGSYMTKQYTTNEVIGEYVDIAELPSIDGNKGNVINGLGYGVYAGSKNTEEATKFALWLGSEDAMRIQGEIGSVIPARNGLENLFIEAYSNYHVAAFTNQAAIASPLPVCKIAAEIYDMQDTYLKRAYAGEDELADVCAELKEAVDAALAKMNG